ncbi:MAG: DNA integrity scanning protein DisA nucleotide-binding domain protein [Vigna little leaf phytoplasma]|nr:DNA integrity scanning protein DisA nucleotide-binding domain protein [Vigna little leaf phytoplasma]
MPHILFLLFLIIFLIFLIYISLHILFSKYELFKIIYSLFLGILFVFALKKIFNKYNFDIKKELEEIQFYNALLTFVFLVPIIIKAPSLRFHLQNFSKFWNRSKTFLMASKNTQKQILDAVMEMSQNKIGALITIEKYNTLEQFIQNSILIDAHVSKELLMNIFIPNTPLHDGAVIIRGNRIISAGAYFMLSEKKDFKKTTGSRHRAALGISENTDSMTLVVSEETGNISIALEGIILKIKDKNQIQEYLTMFMV